MKIKTFTPPFSLGKGKSGSVKSIILLVALLVVATGNAFAQASFETIDGIRYLIDSDAKTASVVASSGDKYSGDVVVPEKVKAGDGKSYPVTKFGDEAFKECKNLTSITIPSSVTSLGGSCFSNCTKLENATFKGKLPSNTLSCGLLNSCIIYVPQTYLQDYKDALGSKYSYIYAFKEEGEDKEQEQCATPSISYTAGKLRFTSSTPNAEYHSTITDTDMMSDKYVQDGVLDLSATYHISVYATAEGYKPSEKATATLYWINANLENTTSININQAKTRGVVATSQDGIVTLSGLDEGEEVRFYAADGKQIGSVRAIDGVASQAVSSNSLVIAKIAGQAIKIAVK